MKPLSRNENISNNPHVTLQNDRYYGLINADKLLFEPFKGSKNL